MKTLNNNKKLNTNFPKPTSLLTAKPSPTKGSNLPLANKAQKQKLQSETQNTILSLKPLKSWPFGQCASQNAVKPSKNSTLLYHHKPSHYSGTLSHCCSLSPCPLFLFILFSHFSQTNRFGSTENKNWPNEKHSR